jgi:lipoyl(octanoyl) transferase
MFQVHDLQTLDYRQAWQVQETVHAQVADGAEERLLIVEHPPVITLGRRGMTPGNLLAGEESLSKLGVQLVHSDRGGDITFHGPGQIVVYPIVRLNDHALSVGGYVRALENSIITALAELNVTARRIPGEVGVWTDDHGQTAKIAAIGVRIRRGVSLHGLALNVETDLSYFNLIVPCGLVGKPVTSLRKLLGAATPPLPRVKGILIDALQQTLAAKELST